MNTFASALASAILMTVASTGFAAAELKLDSRHDIEPVATHSTTPASTASAATTPAAATTGVATEAAKKTVETKYQTAAADHQAAVPPKPTKKVQRKPRPRYVEHPVLVVRPVFRPVPLFRFGRRW